MKPEHKWTVSVLMRDGWRLWPDGGTEPLSWQEAMASSLPWLIKTDQVQWHPPGWRPPEPPEPSSETLS